MSINLLYVLLLISGLMVSASVVIYVLAKDDIPAIAFNPIVLFSIYFGVVHFFTPLIKHLQGYYRYQSGYNDVTLIVVALSTLMLYLLAVILSNAIIKNWQLRGKGLARRYGNVQALIKIALAVFAIGAVAAYLDYKTLADVVGTEVFWADRHLAAEDRGSSRIYANLMIVGFSLYVAAFTSAPKLSGRHLGLSVLMTVCAFGYYSVISSRNSILLMILLGLTAYAANRTPALRRSSGKIKNLMVVGVSVLVVLFSVYILTVERYSTSESSYLQERLNNIVLYMFDGAFGNDEALLWMVDNSYDLKGGKTYVAAFTNIVPRSYWPEKPLGGGPELINMIFPGSYRVGAKGNNSLTTGLLAEAMMNFGVFSLPAIIGLWAFAVNYLIYRAIRSKSLVNRTAYLIISTCLSSALIYSEFLGFLVRIGIYLLPLLIVSKFFPYLGRRVQGVY